MNCHSGWLLWNPDFARESTRWRFLPTETPEDGIYLRGQQCSYDMAEIEGDPHTDFVNRLDLWRQATYSGGVSRWPGLGTGGPRRTG